MSQSALCRLPVPVPQRSGQQSTPERNQEGDHGEGFHQGISTQVPEKSEVEKRRPIEDASHQSGRRHPHREPGPAQQHQRSDVKDSVNQRTEGVGQDGRHRVIVGAGIQIGRVQRVVDADGEQVGDDRKEDAEFFHHEGLQSINILSLQSDCIMEAPSPQGPVQNLRENAQKLREPAACIETDGRFYQSKGR